MGGYFGDIPLGICHFYVGADIAQRMCSYPDEHLISGGTHCPTLCCLSKYSLVSSESHYLVNF